MKREEGMVGGRDRCREDGFMDTFLDCRMDYPILNYNRFCAVLPDEAVADMERREEYMVYRTSGEKYDAVSLREKLYDIAVFDGLDDGMWGISVLKSKKAAKVIAKAVAEFG